MATPNQVSVQELQSLCERLSACIKNDTVGDVDRFYRPNGLKHNRI